jgi:hypothetical protein
MRPPTHDDPNAVPRNGTEVPWLDLDDRSRRPDRPDHRPAAADRDAAPQQEQRRR